MSYVFISHDLAIVRAMAHRVLVMKDGAIIEQGEAEALFAAPRESSTKRLSRPPTWRSRGRISLWARLQPCWILRRGWKPATPTKTGRKPPQGVHAHHFLLRPEIP